MKVTPATTIQLERKLWLYTIHNNSFKRLVSLNCKEKYNKSKGVISSEVITNSCYSPFSSSLSLIGKQESTKGETVLSIFFIINLFFPFKINWRIF